MARRLLILALLPFASFGQPKQVFPVLGLRQRADVLIDRWGVPHIFAGNLADAYLVQGFNAARDRLFQIDLWRRRGLGLMSEVMGPSYVEQDRAARLFLYRGPMEKEWAAYGPDASEIAASFVAGINAYVDWLGKHPESLPVEFKALGYSPSKWDPADVVRIRSHGLTRNLTNEVARANLVCMAGPVDGPRFDQARIVLTPPWKTVVPAGLDPCLPRDVLRVFTLATRTVPFQKPGAEPANEGSNNWVVAPSKSATGRPILAGDPHRAYSTPSLRYIAHISAPGLNIIGAGEPALPGISMGHNGHAAFGLTIFPIDQEDLYVYELNPADARQYRYKDRWEAMRVVRERLAVRGRPPLDVELVFTRHGPVIYTDAARRLAYAVRTCWLESGMAPYFGSIAYMRARTFSEFKRARFRGGAPTVNQVYADVKGNIGWSPGGLLPVRPNWDGLLPVPGDGRFEWAGFLDGELFPSDFNPARGYISTSNEMNLPADYPYRERKLGFEWTNNSRHVRIDEVLRGLEKVSIEDSMKLQTDMTSVPARRLMAMLAPLPSSQPKTQRALELLHNWDGVERADSAQAALFEVWWSRHLARAFLDAVLPAGIAREINSPDAALLLDSLEGKPSPFPLDKTTRNELLLRTLGAAYAEMEKLGGVDPRQWQWGKLHLSSPPHPLRNVVDAELRERLQPGPYPAPGGPYSPSQSQYGRGSFHLTSGPSFRMVLDVGNWDGSKAVNYPGQSGNPDDPHYRDLAPLWLRGEYFPLLYSRSAIERSTERRIELRPATH